MLPLLRIACATMFLGHAWVCWNGDMPLRSILWDESLLGPLIPHLTGMEWASWVSSLDVDDRINAAITVQACLFALFGIASLAPLPNRAAAAILILGTLNLTFLAFLKFWEAGQGLAQFFEHAGQFCLPLILLFALYPQNHPSAASHLAKIAIALTFIGHGIYAIGIPSEFPWLNHPRPGRFTEMTVLGLSLSSESSAGRILLTAGILDLIAAALIFFRGKAQTAALVYMVAWGLLTAIARPWAYFDAASTLASLAIWLPEALYRTPHFAIPLWLLLSRRTPSLSLLKSQNPVPTPAIPSP